MSGSDLEREMRAAIIPWLRERRPGCRIIHELVVGDCRADLAAVEVERITLVEIKSAKDTLKRLRSQARQFEAASHTTVVLADARWFEEFDYANGGRGFRPSGDLANLYGVQVLRYPEPRPGEFVYERRWGLFDHPRPEPHAARMLALLWKDELREECRRHGISATTRTTCSEMIKAMAWLMAGREIARAVCRQLRLRTFAEADAPIAEDKAAA